MLANLFADWAMEQSNDKSTPECHQKARSSENISAEDKIKKIRRDLKTVSLSETSC